MAERNTKNMRKKTPKQIAALLCVALLVSTYFITLIAACLDLADSGRLFAICLAATIGLPILLWIFLWFYGLSKNQHSVPLSDAPDEDNRHGA